MKEELKDIYTILKRNNNNITFTLEEFTEYVLKHTKFKFLYDLKFKTNYILDTIYVSTKNKEIAKKLNNSTKVCNICNETLPIDEFGKDSFSTDGKDSRCKSCSYLRTVRKTNPILNTVYTIKEFVGYIQSNTDYNKRYKIWRKLNTNNLKPILVYKDDGRSKIENVKTGEVTRYKSILEASKKLGILDATIGGRIKGGNTYNGYKYRKI